MKTHVFEVLDREGQDAIRITLTPQIATEMLEANTLNRPLSQVLIDRIARQIREGKWRYNGDTIKVSTGFDVLDGQHRLWAVTLAERPVETLIVFGIDREAFETIDTIRKHRSFADTVAIEGVARHRAAISSALAWLVRYERGVLVIHKQPKNRVENSDVKEAFRANPNIAASAERVGPLRKVVHLGLMTFFHYVLSSQNAGLAETMVAILADPSHTAVDHPFFVLRDLLVRDATTRRDSVRTIALMVKACNAAHRGTRVAGLDYRSGGNNPERFPTLDVGNIRKPKA